LGISQNKTLTEYVLDTSVLIILFEKCHLRDELFNFSKVNKLYVPKRVEEEYFKGEGTKEGDVDFKRTFTSVTLTLENDVKSYFNFQETFGEEWVISQAIQNPSCFCVIDERLGRNVCETFELKLIGTVGILEEMKKLGYFSREKLIEIRQTICSCGFWLSKEMRAELDRVCLSQ
jgi:predicted nucleic acid-binding protein